MRLSFASTCHGSCDKSVSQSSTLSDERVTTSAEASTSRRQSCIDVRTGVSNTTYSIILRTGSSEKNIVVLCSEHRDRQNVGEPVLPSRLTSQQIVSVTTIHRNVELRIYFCLCACSKRLMFLRIPSSTTFSRKKQKRFLSVPRTTRSRSGNQRCGSDV